MDEITDQMLRDRICDASDRIPTSKWPFYGTTLKATIAEGDTEATLEFVADRDTTFTDLSVTVTDEDDVNLGANIDNEYCNVDYIEHAFVEDYGVCCQRKPIYLVGVKENKRLVFTVTLLAAAPAGGAFVEISLSGWQGSGCCP